MGVDKGILNAMQDHRDSIHGPHFIFSADNQKHIAKSEFKLTHDQVVRHLRGAGYDTHELKGSPERRIAVYGVNPDHAEKLHDLAKRLGQESSIYSTGKKHEKRYHHGEKAGQKVFGEGTTWHKGEPRGEYSTTPGGRDHFTHNFPDSMRKSESGDEPGKKDIGKVYKEGARTHCDLLFKVTIKGEKKLAEEIPLHMSLKIFNDMDEFTIDELKEAVKQFDIRAPDADKVKFDPIIFHSKKSDQDYFMLEVKGAGDKYRKFYEHFGKRGVTYDQGFFLHITINEALYDSIKKDGLKEGDLEFSALTLEDGANNTAHVFDDMEKAEPIEKGIKHVAAAIGVAGALATAGAMKQKPAQAPARAPTAASPAQASMYSHKRMLTTISQVESSGGKQTAHKELGGAQAGESAYGKYGLTPNIIRETVHMNRDLRGKYGKIMGLKGPDLQNYMQDNPGLEDKIADKHLSRLEHHFGNNPSKIGYAWLEGITGTSRATKENKDIEGHWHVKKIKDAWKKVK